MLFEPTGDLVKDYSAFCETDDRPERDDILDGIVADAAATPPATIVRLRNLEYCLNKRDAAPLCSAIPHCSAVSTVSLTGCGVTEHSYKLLVEAVYKSCSVHTFAVDFNPDGLFRDPTATKKDRNEVTVTAAQYRGAHLRAPEPEPSKEDPKKAKPDPKKAAAAQQQKEAELAALEKVVVAIPTGWHGILLTGVQVVSLRGNGINDKQAEALALALETNTELLSLSLWGNQITSVGAAALAKALRVNRRLTALNLGHNRIDDAGIAALLRALLCQDVTNEEALQQRRKVHAQATELPTLPTYNDLIAAAHPVEETKKDPKKKEPAPKPKKGAEGPVERPKTEFDRECVRLSDATVRIPGNTTLWSLVLSNNLDVTPAAIDDAVRVLSSREPPIDSLALGDVPAPFVSPFLALEQLDLDHPRLPETCQPMVAKALAAARQPAKS